MIKTPRKTTKSVSISFDVETLLNKVETIIKTPHKSIEMMKYIILFLKINL